MDIRKAIRAAMNRKIERGWEKIYMLVDIHDTIIHASYENVETFRYFPSAREALQLMTNRDDVCLILWSSTYKDKLDMYVNHFCGDGIRFDFVNGNPEVGNTHLSDFEAKLYYNVGIDDKFGFEPETDWLRIIEELSLFEPQ